MTRKPVLTTLIAAAALVLLSVEVAGIHLLVASARSERGATLLRAGRVVAQQVTRAGSEALRSAPQRLLAGLVQGSAHFYGFANPTEAAVEGAGYQAGWAAWPAHVDAIPMTVVVPLEARTRTIRFVTVPTDI